MKGLSLHPCSGNGKGAVDSLSLAASIARFLSRYLTNPPPVLSKFPADVAVIHAIFAWSRLSGSIHASDRPARACSGTFALPLYAATAAGG